jgi:hypothetical protein
MVLFIWMKSAFLIPLRYLILLIVFMLSLALASFGLAKTSGYDFQSSLILGVTRTVSAFPFLCLCSLFITSFRPLRRQGNMPVSFVLLFSISFASLSFGTLGLDSVLKASKPSTPKAIVAVPSGITVRAEDNLAFFAESWSGDGRTAQNTVLADFSSQSAKGSGTILSFHAKRELLTTPRNPLRLEDAKAQEKPLIVKSLEGETAATRAFVRKGKNLFEDLIASAAVAIFFASLWIFARLPPWKLAGVFLSLAAFMGALFLLSSIASADFLRLMTGLTSPSIAKWSPHGILVLGAALLVLWDILLTLKRGRPMGEEP